MKALWLQFNINPLVFQKYLEFGIGNSIFILVSCDNKLKLKGKKKFQVGGGGNRNHVKSEIWKKIEISLDENESYVENVILKHLNIQTLKYPFFLFKFFSHDRLFRW